MKYFHFISADKNSLKDIINYSLKNTHIKLHESIDKFENYLKSINESLVFLDIDFNTKFEILENIDKLNQIGSKVIVVSKDKLFAYDAIKAGAYNYILKSNFVKDSLYVYDQYSGNPPLKKDTFDKIAINCNDATYYLSHNEIIRCIADGNYTRIISKEKNILVAKTLRKIEALLPVNLFCRTHRSHIVNLKHISKIQHEKGGTIVTSDNYHIPISRSRKILFTNKIQSYGAIG